MPGSEGKRELGGLARSIDALFSGPRPAPASAEGEDATDAEPEREAAEIPELREEIELPESMELREEAELRKSMELREEAELLEEAEDVAGVEVPPDLEPVVTGPPPLPEQTEPSEPDVVDDALADLEGVEVAPDFAAQHGTEAPEDVPPRTFEEPPPLPEAPEDAQPGTFEEPIPVPETATDEGAAPEGLADAVEAFLGGSAGAAEEVETIAAALRERMALDPLADAVERLTDAAGELPDPEILEMARSIMNPAVASRLVQRMGHERDEDRLAGYERMCQRLGVVMANAFRGALTDSTEEHARRVYYDALIGMGEASRSVIEEMVEDDNRFLVLNAVAILGEIGGSRAVELVTSALANTDPRVRREALLSLGKLGDEEAGRLVLGSFEDPDHSVRVAAAIASGELGLERALRPILGMLADEDDPEVCISLLRALGQVGDPGAVQAIEKLAVGGLFSKPRTDVRVAAYRALHAIGTPHARQLLEQARSDKDRGVQIVVRDLMQED